MEIQIRLGKIDEDHYFLQVKVLAFADLNLNVFTRLQFLVKVLAVSQLHYTFTADMQSFFRAVIAQSAPATIPFR